MSKISEKLFKVFVYGTLKAGEPNHHWLTRPENGISRYLGTGTTVVKFPLVVGTRYNIPFLLDKRDIGHNIQGEVYEIDELMFTNLDVLEDYPTYYDREIQTIAINDETISCWLYLLRKFPAKLLAKPHLKSYHNTPEQPYRESYLESSPSDIYESDQEPEKSS